MSRPLLDRIDLHVEVPRVAATALGEEPWAKRRRRRSARVLAAPSRQRARYAGPSFAADAHVPGREVRR